MVKKYISNTFSLIGKNSKFNDAVFFDMKWWYHTIDLNLDTELFLILHFFIPQIHYIFQISDWLSLMREMIKKESIYVGDIDAILIAIEKQKVSCGFV